MVNLSLTIVPYLTGCFHIQTYPAFTYSDAETVLNARRIVEIFKAPAPSVDPKRVCIKIPSTWEGLQACKIREKKGITTLATTLFTMTQAVLAAQVGCHYIAPYVNDLMVHFVPEWVILIHPCCLPPYRLPVQPPSSPLQPSRLPPMWRGILTPPRHLPSYTDPAPQIDLCVAAQHYFEKTRPREANERSFCKPDVH
ncbi:hypothetical protein MMC25_008062 [Agyrium rufum]|nr:hypothetical protein [Agyrium rufum]